MPFNCCKLFVTAAISALLPCAATAADVSVNWLGGTPAPITSGVSWGVPWAKGAVQKNQAFTLTTADGKILPLQSWPLAYWQDGSVKWSGFATVASPQMSNSFTLSPNGNSESPANTPIVRVTENADEIQVDTGRLICLIPKHGPFLVDSMTIDGREIARQGKLVAMLEDRSELETKRTLHLEDFTSDVTNVTVEQSGPVRAVVKFDGMHKSQTGSREWLPFHVRLYFYAGEAPVRMVHTFVFDGDQEKDFIRGLGVSFSVPMREEVQNRHVRFSGEDSGLWAEPIQPLIGRQGRFVADPNGGGDVYPKQIDGQRVPNRAQVNTRAQSLMQQWAVWSDFKLVQPNADGFTIVKRTNPQSTWLAAGAGKRASGLVFVGDASGGLAVSLKNFWQSYPASLEVRHAASDAAELVVWFWSPDAPAMDMRHYDTVAHGLEAAYEDVQPGFSSATGIARTSELTLFPTAGIPTKQETALMAQAGKEPPVLVCTPQYLHDAQAFGIWGLEDRSTPAKRAIEERLDSRINYYLTQPEQRRWYGFWDFGNVMHSYDSDRHVWRYDLGGMAWDNSELGTDMWLWYSFLRSGRADIFRMAEAMTRQTGEVDCYHLGKFAGLGSRHNVREWGDGAKEARISQAGYRRFYYYLTTDERTGDVMREMLNADFKTVEFDPMREARPITEAEKKIAPTRVRLGPDWFAFLGNWMTEWERTGDVKWRDKILAGVDSLAKMPLGLRSGNQLVMGYDPATGKLYQLDDQLGTYNLATIMGGAEVVFELNLMLDDERWQKLWLQYCRLYSAPREVIVRDMTTGTEGADASYARDGRLAAYVYLKTGNEAYLQHAISALAAGGGDGRGAAIRKIKGPDVLNPVDDGPANTNGSAQDGLETITMLGMIGDKLPAEFPAQSPAPGGRRGNRGGGNTPAPPAIPPGN
jgi:hypothetical protein